MKTVTRLESESTVVIYRRRVDIPVSPIITKPAGKIKKRPSRC